jgi:translation initiation factor 3 subunit A
MVEDEQYHKEMHIANAEKHKKTWEVNVEEKKRLSKMSADKEGLKEQIMSRRSEEFAALALAREERVAEMKALRKAGGC